MNENISRRVRRSESQWQELIQAQQTSGLSAQSFCKEQNLGYAGFCKWRNRLLDTVTDSSVAKTGGEQDFIDLSTLTASDADHWRIVLKLGDGMELQLSRN